MPGARRGVSARARIVGWMLLVVGIAMGCSVFVTAEVLALRADNLATDALNHEVDNFRAFVASPTGTAATTVDGLLTDYLEVNVPDSGETFFTMLDDRPRRRTQVTPPARLDIDAAFVAHVAGADEPESGWWDSSAGKVRYGVLPVVVDGDRHTGSLVILQFRDVQAQPLFASVRVFALVGLAALLVAGVASWLVAGRVLEPVRLVRQTAERISESDLERRIPVSGNDDVARLARTFNTMLDRLQAAFGGQRQFLDDAGHELRTPITVIRGHLELMEDDPQDRAETLALVMDELDRMRRIVDDLSDLAKSERPDFLTWGDVDLADLTVDLLASARVLADRSWAVDTVAEGVVRADGQRLRQALLQLVANAVDHTQPGDRISVGSAHRADGLVRLWVADTGSGVADEDAPYVFERFRRGSGSRRRSGAGLGLSIVRSIAEAHHGRVVLESSGPGEGATFVLELPLTEVSSPTIPRGTDEDGGPCPAS